MSNRYAEHSGVPDLKTALERALQDIAKPGITNIRLLAMVSEGFYSVSFYGDWQGVTMYSNVMAEEEDILDINDLEDFYENVYRTVRKDSAFVPDKMNVVTLDPDGKIQIRYEERSRDPYGIEEEWEQALGVGR